MRKCGDEESRREEEGTSIADRQPVGLCGMENTASDCPRRPAARSASSNAATSGWPQQNHGESR